MKLRYYNTLNLHTIPNLKRFASAVEADDFGRLDVKKLGDNLYRTKLGKKARLLFSFYQHDGTTDCLVLEHLPNHDYDKSRFLARGVQIDEERLTPVPDVQSIEAPPLVYLNPASDRFHVLDKVLSFDDDQQTIFELPPPLVLVGSAGSGKTALTLEKMKQAVGDVLYVSLSPFLVESARSLYFANGYSNEDQNLDFLSLREFIESIEVPVGREVSFKDFDAWFQRHKGGSGLKDAHALYEEFRGVITAAVSEKPALSREDYFALGVRQSIFPESERKLVYTLFEKWCQHLATSDLYDPGMLAHEWRGKTLPRYDFIVIDEVQDFTNVQLSLVLQCLVQAGDFLLCGDANQIVHPNFFSWSKLKSLFFDHRELTGQAETLAILHANYRNSPLVTNVANRILKLKHARFGSVDRESNHLVRSQGAADGQLQLLADSPEIQRDLDARTGRSARFAVIVMRAEDKARASEAFSTPLVFSIQEAKGLEYENIILFNLVASEEKAFREITAGVAASDLEGDELDYARAKSKTDKSLEVYKFYINALYVAVTRAVKSLYIIEQRIDHPALVLLDLERFSGELALDKNESSLEEWQREARKLELQGKREQAEAIHERILRRKPVPWPVIERKQFAKLRHDALENGHKKQLLRLYEYVMLHRLEAVLSELKQRDFKPASQPEEKALKQLYRNHFMTFELSSSTAVLKDTERYGVDYRTVFNWTPLMTAARAGNTQLVCDLLDRGADRHKLDNHGRSVVHQSLDYACVDARYARRIATVWHRLQQGSVVVQVEGRLQKLHEQLMALFLLQLCIARFHRSLGTLAGTGGAFSAKFFADCVADLPTNMLPEKRKRQQYISSVLSGNEVDRDAPYNRRLFKRIRRGHYIINPNLQLRIDDSWVPIHEILLLDELGVATDDDVGLPIHSEEQRQLRQRVTDQWRWQREQRLKQFVSSVQSMILGSENPSHTVTEVSRTGVAELEQ